MSTKRNSVPPTRKNKKAKTTSTALELAPLGSFLGNPSNSLVHKDEDELELEEAVFGRAKTAKSLWDLGAAEAAAAGLEGSDEEVETGLERLGDDSLFYVDVPPTASTSTAENPAFESAFPASDESDLEITTEPTPQPSKVLSSRRNLRQPAWIDPADRELTVSLKSAARLRKLRATNEENLLNGEEYETRLRRQFEKMHPTPVWAIEARKKVMKRKAKALQGNAARVGGEGSETEDSDAEDGAGSDDDEEIENLFRTVEGKKTSRRRGKLAQGEIDIDRVRDANQADSDSHKIVQLGFHPRAQVLFSATDDRRLKLFQIDGTENSLLQSLHLPELPISSAAFHPSGSSILLTGNRPYFISYDLQSGQSFKRTLLTNGLGGSDRAATGGQGGMERFEFSPDGEMLAVGGRKGYVHLVDWGAGGQGSGGQVIGQVKMNVGVKSIAWQKGGKELLTLGEDSQVYVWDLGTRKCITKWKDEGGFGANILQTDSRDEFTAVGSTTGIVNLYEKNSLPLNSGAERKSLKSIENLTTAVTSIKFNYDSQLMAIASQTNKDALKLVHLPSATVFSNWPTQQTPLHHVTAMDFSRGSEWLAVGNKRGKILLYSVKHYTR